MDTQDSEPHQDAKPTRKGRTAGRKWLCNSCGDTKVGPERPRRNATVRFCLTCSGSSGVLVVRTCPALDAERAQREVRARGRAKAKAARGRELEARRTAAREAKFHVAGVDIRAEAARYWRALVDICGSRRSLCLVVPSVEMVWTVRGGACRGWARSWVGPSGQVRLRINPIGADPWRVRELLLHELAHCAVGCREKHSLVFKKCLNDAARELWGVQADVIPTRRKYDLDEILRAKLWAKYAPPAKVAA